MTPNQIQQHSPQQANYATMTNASSNINKHPRPNITTSNPHTNSLYKHTLQNHQTLHTTALLHDSDYSHTSSSQQHSHSNAHSRHLQDMQATTPERREAFRKFSRRLQLTSLLLIPMLTMLAFTEWWWTTFLLLSLLGCIAVYYRAAQKNQRLSIIMFFILLLLNEMRSVAVILMYLVHVVHLSSYQIVILSIAALDCAIFTPICLYFTYWLLKAIQLEVFFLQQATSGNNNGDDDV